MCSNGLIFRFKTSDQWSSGEDGIRTHINTPSCIQRIPDASPFAGLFPAVRAPHFVFLFLSGGVSQANPTVSLTYALHSLECGQPL